ncbi:MAG: filamentous hemagglutinin family protein [Chromatiales bacterium]|nr:filamentous hemagglutinin family protein [Chromatiales bacterium]
MSLYRRIGLTLGVALYVAFPGLPAAELPVPCAGGSCVGVPGFVSDGAATAVVNAAGTTLDVNQTTSRAVLNWAEFNVGAGKTVNFKQPGADALAVNRIFQGSPSQIFGAISANGQIYLINQNGILFKPGSQVNVSSLIASSLQIDPEALSGGILNPALLTQGKAAFASDGRVFVIDGNGQVVNGPDGQPLQVKVAVEEGATLRSDAKGGGRIALLAQQVENAGTIEAPGGQAILAAGEKVYLQASEDPELRGLLVEVDVGGKAWNQATGRISSSLGNVTMVGLAVNQDGRASATTSVQANGSVRLLARDTVTVTRPTNTTFALLTQKAGAAELGSGSVTEVTPDQATLATTAVDDQRQLPSTVEVVGREVTFRGGSLVRVPGGEITVQALPNPSVTRPTGETPLPVDAQARILVESGARIDASGSTADVSITRNVVAVELRSNELKDAPLQRDGPLRGKTVFVDARVGTPLADVSGALATIPRDINERTSAGGTISLVSQGSVDVAAGATVDVSGGGINYAGGVIRTSWLVTPDRRLVEIGSADPDSPYTDVLNPTVRKVYERWGIVEERPVAGFGRFEPGYFEGRDAGTVQIAAPGIALNGALVGKVTADVRQRTPTTQPLGGRLVIGLPDGQGLTLPDFRAPSIRLADGPGSGTGDVLDLATRYFDEGGFTRASLYSNGTITVAPGDGALTLGPRGSLQLTAARVDVNRAVSVPGGVIEARSVTVNPLAPGATGGRPGVSVADGVVLDTSGRWVNDTPGVAPVVPADPVVLDGGRVTLAVDAVGGELRVGDGVALRADGGAWLDARGRLQTGAGGDVAVLATGTDVSLATLGGLDLSAWGLQQRGGTLRFGANRIRVAADGAAMGEAQTADPLAGDVPYVLRPEFFGQGGFREYRVVASGKRSAAGTEPLVIAGNAALSPRQQQRQLTGDFAQAATGTAITAVSREFLPRPDLRDPASLAFAYEPHAQVTPSNAGALVMGQGASIDLDPGGTVDFTAPTRIRIDGSIVAPSGGVTATLVRPPASLDEGFDPAAGIFFGGQALVDLRGAFIATPNDVGLRQGTVRDGGRVNLVAERGRIELAEGATVDVAGAQAVLDLPAAGGVSTGPVTVATTVGSRGGRVDLLAPEGIVLDATLRGAGGTASNAGATLALGVSRQRGFDVEAELLPTFPATPREIVMGSGVAPANGVAGLDPSRLAGSGFDGLVLQADDRIRFASPVDLAFRNRLELQAPNIVAPGTGDVALQANYVALGPQLRGGPPAGAATAGASRLGVTAGTIDLSGDVALQGFGDVALSARQDIRATGLSNDTGTVLSGSLSTAGALTLTAAQVYPTTFSDYLIRVLPGSAPGVLRILPSGQAPGTVLSAAGKLRLEAASIEQAGVLRAPLGEIELNASGSLDLAPGSVTSTASVGQVVPFGRVSAGTSWTYEAIPGLFAPIAAPRAQRIALNADQVRVAEGASVDVRGGGDVYAYEFLPGPGGSTDALAAGANPNLFAIVPGVRFGAYDTQEYRGTSLQPGDSVRLAEVPGLLPAGEYALLPARYALLPGAVLVEARPEVQDIVPGEVRSLADGARVAAGVRTIAGTDIADSRTIGFAVRPGSFGRELAEYRDYFGNSFFPARATANDAVPPLVARDAGAVQFGVGSELDLAGQLLLDPDRGDAATPADDGRGARIDLSAERLRVVASAGSGPAGVVEVEAAALSGLPAESILLGGVRRAVSDGVEVDPAARTVEIAENVTLTGNEVLLVGRETVTVGDGARLATTGERIDQGTGVLRITGDGGSAVVRVSRRPLGGFERTGTGAAGDVLIGTGATLAASGSVLVDAAGTARSFGGYEVGTGGLAFGSGRIVLGADQRSVTDGLALDAGKLAAIGSAGELRLRARESIDVAGTATLGSSTARPARLVLDAPGIRRLEGDAALQAGELVVRNTSGLVAADPAEGGGSLTLAADRLVFAGGDFAVGGFGAFGVQAAAAVLASGDATVRSGAALDILTPVLAGDPGSQLTLAAPGRDVTLRRPAGPLPPTVAAVGAALEVSGGSVTADTALLYPAGRVRLIADDTVTIGSNAVVDVSGRRLDFAGERVDVAGGAVEVVARSGGVQFEAGSRVDVSAGTGNAAAGSLRILAAGDASFAGGLEGGAGDAGRSGLFDLVAAGIDSLGDVAARLAAGGFRRFIGIETTGGDLTLAAGETVRANEVVVAASGGALTVDGQVDASGADGGGRIVLAAREDLTVGATAGLDARATGQGGRGGEILLASTAGDASLAAGSRLRLDGAGGEAGGELLVRVARDGNDARLAVFDATIEGAAKTILEPVLTTAPVSNIVASTITGFRNTLNAYMSAAPAAIRSRLGSAADNLLVRPALEVVGNGDIRVGAAWDFATWRWDGQPGYLTIRAPGSLDVAARISDGFTGTGLSLAQLAGDSWSYRLVAGADRDSALPLAVRGRLLDAGEEALTLGAGVTVRTGTGDIRLASAGDVVFGSNTTTVYTAGVAARAPSNTGGLRASWSRDGGDISLAAGRDIVAELPSQLLSGWNVRISPTGPVQWAIDYNRFAQGIGALAGGRVDISAGRDVANIAATVATTRGEIPGQLGTFETWGGGDLRVAAGRDVLGGTWSTWDGDTDISAGRSITFGTTADFTEIAPTIASGRGQVSLLARSGIDVGAFVNPTVVSPANFGAVALRTFFYNYLQTDAVTLTSLAGDVRIFNDVLALDAVLPGASGDTAFGVLPPTLRARATGGDVELVNGIRMLPGQAGQLELIAAGSVRSPNGAELIMSDALPGALPSADVPAESGVNAEAPFLPTARAAIHAGDDRPVVMVAAGGDVAGGAYELAKHFRVVAARDVRDISLSGQNTSSTQISLVQAGRDVRLSSSSRSLNDRIELGGPGRLQVIAGRNIELGFSRGITSVGQTLNPQLPGGGGAALDVWAGLGGEPAYGEFNQRYWVGQYGDELARYTGGDEDFPGLIGYVAQVTGRPDLTTDNVWTAWAGLQQDQQQAYLAQLQPQDQITFTSFVDLVDALVSYTNSVTGRSDLQPTTAVDAYIGFAIEQQRPLVQEFFFRELRDSGRESNVSRSRFGFQRGQDAVGTLFPDAVDYSGDLGLLFSRIYTLAGGDINLLVPGGLLNVGLAVPPADQAITRQPSELGIVTQGPGRVQVFSDGDVLVNQSRIFTLQGGDITIWSDNGNIDAGRGSKTSISAPPPVIRVDASGNVTVEFADAIAGSGIRGILTDDTIPPGDVDLVAPNGEINAGDAGIGSAGNINIAAPIVVGVDNIQVGGAATGVPTDTGLAAGLTGVSGLSNAVAQSAQASATEGASGDEAGSLADAALALLDVLIEGYGDGSGDDDEACDPDKDPRCRP